MVDPAVQLRTLQRAPDIRGDCDDAATLGATLAKALGRPARFRVLAFRPGAPYGHVVTDVWDGRAWRDLDVTGPAQNVPVHVARSMTFPA